MNHILAGAIEKLGILMVLIMEVSGCKSLTVYRSERPLQGRDFEFAYADMPTEKRVKVSLKSMSKREICTGVARWPDLSGKMRDGNVFLMVGERMFAYKNRDFGLTEYCPTKSCFSPMNEGEQIESSFYYVDFDLPASSYTLPKTLKFEPDPYWCDLGRYMKLH